jgi:hypothetical protein
MIQLESLGRRVAALLAATAALTLSRVRPLASGKGGLKCHDIKGESEK